MSRLWPDNRTARQKMSVLWKPNHKTQKAHAPSQQINGTNRNRKQKHNCRILCRYSIHYLPTSLHSSHNGNHSIPYGIDSMPNRPQQRLHAGKSRTGLQRHRIHSRNLQHHHAGHRPYILYDRDLTNYISRSRAEVARKAHNLDVAGSSPASATKRCCHTSCRGAANP